MRDEWLLLWLFGLPGWVLGIVGFFRATAARKDLKALQLSMQAAYRARMAAGDPAAPVAAAPMSTVPEAAAPVVEAAPVVVEPVAAEAMEVPAAEPEPVAAVVAEAPAPVQAAARIDMEALLTQRWGMWAGAVALLFAGVFLVRYAAEQGMMGPAGRCAMGFVLGLLLLAGAEWVRRNPPKAIAGKFAADQTPGAMAAGGAAILFGVAYAVGGYYEFVPPAVGFAIMALAAGIGLAASLRFGPMAAAVGLAAGFATPALVASKSGSVTGLFVYLLVVSLACFAVMRWTAWTWLGWAASAGGALWELFAADIGPKGIDAWATALFIPLVVAANLQLLPPAALNAALGRRMAWLPMTLLGAAGLIGHIGGESIEMLAGLFLLGPVAVWYGMRDDRLDRLDWLAAGWSLLALLTLRLPSWKPTGEPIVIDGMMQTMLPGDWVPAALGPFLATALALAAFHAGVGLWLERRAPRPLVWSALPAAVPVLALAVAYERVALFQTSVAWGAGALLLAAGLIYTADLARRAGQLQAAGVHASGATAAIALACGMVLEDHWLTLALSAILPALALIEARVDLRALRRVAFWLAVVVLLRLLPNWNILYYPFGRLPFVNGLVIAYFLPAVVFAVAAWMFRRRGEDSLVNLLDGGAAMLVAAFAVLEVRHWQGRGDFLRPGGFAEAAWNLTFLAIQARIHLWLAHRSFRRVYLWAWRIEGVLALVLSAVVILANPVFDNDPAHWTTIAAAYLVPALVIATLPATLPQRRWLGLLAVAQLFIWVFVQVRLWFHPGRPRLSVGTTDAEMWAWSGGWLLLGALLLALGMLRDRRDMRQAGLVMVAIVTAKAFLLDMAGLTGLWRAGSFLGLGLALIGLGAAYRRFVLPRAGALPHEP